ncbi:DUF4145 domain-containing protein [Staphylococcus saprophyticus]|uniref:DUF4145 domain-containing protein n=1 Tax=Staphylococcus saprophyticus TaxID=29385 RepID=UPI00157CC2B9|nr:DUF4145 domain-containing protein [Staphylococcus saprophyticus]MDW4038689.1 DUF4145 domain-containing protein [Staphylococcus saprophyticus]MDW4088918.1 DUF4145 domain-containing protein [Staphylococcus saprophyticus]QKQ03439.1 DUF4145 domain-containing protein [Staphylococcus saprophyticus]
MSNYELCLPISKNNEQTNSDILVEIELPKNCPYCNQLQTPIIKSTSNIETDDLFFSVIFKCNNCSQHFIQQYKRQSSSHSLGRYRSKQIAFHYQDSSNELTEALKECSPSFVDIKIQLDIAEKHNLDALLKLGYRKAVEQLVWDYLIKYENKNEKSLQGKSFANRINLLNFIDSDWLSDLIAWIGNDGAHPYQRHESLTIEDMKELSSILIINIETLIKQKRYKTYHSENK